MNFKKRLLRKVYNYLPVRLLEKLVNIKFKSSHYPIVFMFHHVIPDSELKSYAQKYHSDTPDYDVGPFSVSPERFEEVLLILKDLGFCFLFEDDFQKNNVKSAIITFDDGYTDNYLFAFPILLKHGIKASINLIADEITDSNEHEFVSRARIREMRESGLIQFQAHTMSHKILTQCSDEELITEIVDCKKSILDKTGIESSVFVYPCCNADKRVYDVVKHQYKIAYGGENQEADYIYRIPRIEIDMSFDKQKLLSRMLFAVEMEE